MEIIAPSSHVPRNKGKLVGQKAPFKLKEIRAIRIHLQIAVVVGQPKRKTIGTSQQTACSAPLSRPPAN
jgi:hypothetical protein